MEDQKKEKTLNDPGVIEYSGGYAGGIASAPEFRVIVFNHIPTLIEVDVHPSTGEEISRVLMTFPLHLVKGQDADVLYDADEMETEEFKAKIAEALATQQPIVYGKPVYVADYLHCRHMNMGVLAHTYLQEFPPGLIDYVRSLDDGTVIMRLFDLWWMDVLFHRDIVMYWGDIGDMADPPFDIQVHTRHIHTPDMEPEIPSVVPGGGRCMIHFKARMMEPGDPLEGDWWAIDLPSKGTLDSVSPVRMFERLFSII